MRDKNDHIASRHKYFLSSLDTELKIVHSIRVMAAEYLWYQNNIYRPLEHKYGVSEAVAWYNDFYATCTDYTDIIIESQRDILDLIYSRKWDEIQWQH